MYKAKSVTETIDKREILMRSAIKLFSENGFDAVTTRMIAADAGVNPALIAYYFNSKDGFFDAIVERIPAFSSKLRGIQELSVGAAEKLGLALEAYFDRIVESPEFAKMIIRELSLKKRSHYSLKLMESFKNNQLILSEIIKTGQDTGEFKKDVDYKMLLLSFFSMLMMLVNTKNLCSMMLDAGEEVLDTHEFRIRAKKYLKSVMAPLVSDSNAVAE